ncbi:Atypical PilZ domain-containing protein, cyclic di-GMP receptor [Pseudoxanthomonas sp. CF385]|uniref:PilZ domain-containing protein n=1 Tax=Pseudoxanthomonas sp. CF385 TaxID=1881042 RepID=UPI000888B861|nr:PilZ domain-containing protein [Pseudoxanthomonas sp. CF385]SDR12998.1 Atypical PilZ domain-containing protein, cyclic di-GMP receptor [Pseudoxanthomonas sp. CF385]
MAAPVVLVEHPAEHALFDGALTCDVVLPVRFTLGARPVMQGPAEALLQGLAVAEDVRGDDPDDRKEATPSQQRIEAKLDLVLSLLGRLARRQDDMLPVTSLRWSHRGLRLDIASPLGADTGADGVVTLQPATWLSDHIELPARVLAQVEGLNTHHLWLQFEGLGAGLAEAMDRHLFRLHRRQVAEARQSHLSPRR